VASPDGQRVLRAHAVGSGPPDQTTAATAADHVLHHLIDAGADELVRPPDRTKETQRS
jgi:hypothetical protein